MTLTRRLFIMESKFERVDEKDPRRCQGIIQGNNSQSGQCNYKAVDGGTFCLRHGGGKQADENKKKDLKHYQLTRYRQRVQDIVGSTDIKDLREEIGICRVVLEEILNTMTNANQVLIYSERISSLVNQIRQLIESSQKLEERNNNLLDRKIVMLIGDNIVTILAQYITDSDQLDDIGVKICESIAAAASGANPARIIP